MISFVESNENKKIICYHLIIGDDNMPGYILFEDILDDMTQNISYIKLKNYINKRTK